MKESEWRSERGWDMLKWSGEGDFSKMDADLKISDLIQET